MREAPLPNAFVGGAQKSGTTSLHRLLEAHPEVFFPSRPQEIHYFDLEENYRRGLGWYQAHFADWSREPVIAQTSPLYLYEEAVPGRIAQVVPEARFLFILRHPVDRAYSHYWHAVRYGQERRNFETALDLEEGRLARGAAERRAYSYVDRGRYAGQVRRFQETFGTRRVLVLLHDELAGDPAALAARCARFLEIDPGAFPPAAGRRRNHNPARLPRWRWLQGLVARPRRSWPRLGYAVDRLNLRAGRYPAMAPATRRCLEEVFAPEIQLLEEVTGLDLSSWRSRTDEGVRA